MRSLEKVIQSSENLGHYEDRTLVEAAKLIRRYHDATVALFATTEAMARTQAEASTRIDDGERKKARRPGRASVSLLRNRDLRTIQRQNVVAIVRPGQREECLRREAKITLLPGIAGQPRLLLRQQATREALDLGNRHGGGRAFWFRITLSHVACSCRLRG
jgi:hypothetical protein